MRYAKPIKFSTGLIAQGLKSGALAALILGLAPVQTQAADSCNAVIDIDGVAGPHTFFVGDTLTLKARLGAGRIVDADRPGTGSLDKPYIDFSGIGYGLDCGASKTMGTLSDCKPTGGGTGLSGHNIEFLGVSYSDCPTSSGDSARWPLPESDNIVAIPVLNGEVRQHFDPGTGAGETCRVDVDFVVKDLHDSTNWITQALGVPFDSRTSSSDDDMVGTCSNGLGAGNYEKTTFQVQSCGISIEKQVSLNGTDWDEEVFAYTGEDVYYRVVVTNTGTAPLVGTAIVNDAILGIVGEPVDVNGLVSGGSIEIDGGLIPNFDIKADCVSESWVETENTAQVTAWCRGYEGSLDEVRSQDVDTASHWCRYTPEEPPTPHISLIKTGELILGDNGIADAGIDTINYSFEVTNDGETTLTNVTLTDDLVVSFTCQDVLGNPLTNGFFSLLPLEQAFCNGSYTITAADIEAGERYNLASVIGDSPIGIAPPQVTDEDDHLEPIPIDPGIMIEKQISLGGEEPWIWFDADDAGSAPVTLYPADAYYRFVITNTGNKTLTGVTVNDTMLGIVDYPVGTLLPGEEVIISEIMADDDNLLFVVNRCTSQSDPLNIADVAASYGDGTVDDEDPAYLRCVGDPGIQILKQISLDGVDWEDNSVTATFPDKVYYRIIVLNTGDVPLTNVRVKDTDLPIALNYTYPVTLGVGQSFTLVGVVEVEGTIYRGELEVADPCGDLPGEIPNTAGVYFGDSDDVRDSDPANLICEGDPVIKLTKWVRTGAGEWQDANDLDTALVGLAPLSVEYKIVVENLGDLNLTGVTVTDGQRGVDHEIGDLAAKATYTLRGGACGAEDEPCTSLGELNADPVCTLPTPSITNTASVTGDTEEIPPRTVTGGDPAIVVCTGTPGIQVVKELGICEPLVGELPAGGIACTVKNLVESPVDGVVTWYEDDLAPEQESPADAWYRFTVSNTGNEDLTSVTLNDPTLGIVDYDVGALPYGSDPVVIDMGDIPELYVVELCGTDDVTNIAAVSGIGASGSVTSSDWAMLDCARPPVIICGVPANTGTKPSKLVMEYNGTLESYNSQGVVGVPPGPGALPQEVIVRSYDKPKPEHIRELKLDEVVSIGDDFDIGGWGGDGRIPANILIEFWDVAGTTVLQSVIFHGSCSAPLIEGESFGGATIIWHVD